MSDKSAHKDPSMEEILGSIRRIISEDSAQGGPAQVGGVEVEDDEDVLELTDEVSEEEPAESRREPIFGIRQVQPGEPQHGEEEETRREPILGLKRAQPADDAPEEYSAAVEETVAEETPPQEPGWPDAEALPEDYEAGTEELPESLSEQAEMPGEAGSGEPYEHAEVEEQPHGYEGYEAAEPQHDQSELPAQEEQPMTMSMSSDESAGGEGTESAPGSGEIMSESASEATSAALGELNRAMTERGNRMKVGEGEVTIAEVVKELLRPMLREWLDENLPGIVERVVKREIQKLVDRTQDDD